MFISTDEKQKVDDEIKALYEVLINKIGLEYPCIDYSPGITNSLSFLLKQNKITIDEIRQEFTWYINRMDARILNYFGNEELKKSINEFEKCGAEVDIFIRSETKARFKYKNKLNVFAMDKPLEHLKEMENRAFEFFGYKKDKWIIKEIFSGNINIENDLKMREAAYKKFISLEFLRFEEEWEEFLLRKETEIKKNYENALEELLKEMKKGDFKWLKYN